MFTHISMNVHVVWNDALYAVTAQWVDDDASEPISLYTTGRVSVDDEERPGAVLQRCVRHFMLVGSLDARGVGSD